MIEVYGLVKTIKNKNIFSSQKKILQNISFKLHEGKVNAIIGQNGAGKSTVIKAILGFTSVDSGSVKVREDITIGYLPENPYYYDYLTMRELLWFSARSYGMKKADFQARVMVVAEKVDMVNELDQRLRTFSKGMTQRAGIAAAIVHDPDLLIFDEPMSGLDPVGRKMVFDLITELRQQGKTVLFCSHVLSDVERLCDEVYIMHAGEVCRQLTSAELKIAQNEVEVVVPTSDVIEQLLISANYRIKNNAKHISIYVDNENVDSALVFLVHNKVTIISVQTLSVPLEKAFFDVVSAGGNV